MPLVRPGWTLLQALDLRVGAIEYLRTIERRSCQLTFFSDWWDFWRAEYGIPDPDNWDDVHNYEYYVAEYRRRVLRTIRWHACRGRHAPSNSVARMNRIRSIRREILDDFAHFRALGVNFHERRVAQGFEHLFEDTIRGFTMMELRSHPN